MSDSCDQKVVNFDRHKYSRELASRVSLEKFERVRARNRKIKGARWWLGRSAWTTGIIAVGWKGRQRIWNDSFLPGGLQSGDGSPALQIRSARIPANYCYCAS